jgi:hypothetical protein
MEDNKNKYGFFDGIFNSQNSDRKMIELTKEQYEQKRSEVIAKFNKQFIDNNYSTDPYTHSAIELLIRGVNPYEIIENLITSNQRLLAEYDKLINYQPQPPIILKKE